MTPRRFAGPAAILLSICLVGACKRDASSSPELDLETAVTFIGRDSAGVRIVEYPESAWRETAVWRLDTVPILAIGVVDGPPEYELAGVSAALRLEDGTVVVASSGSGDIRFYDPNGDYIRSVGRRGEGPGEYRFASLLARFGADSLLVWDGILQRGTILARDGAFARTFPRPDLRSSVSVRGVFGDGSLLGTASPPFLPGDFPTGVVRQHATYIRFHPAGRVDTIAVLPSDEGYSTPGSYIYGLPFSRHAVAAATGTYLHYGSSDTYEIRTYTVNGKLVRILRSDRATPLTRREITRALAGVNSRARSVFSRISYPETMPAYAAMKTDAADNLWVGDYLEGGEGGELEQGWTIFGAAGDFRARFIAPPRFTIHDIGDDYVLGTARDEMDVEHVLVYRIIKPEARP